MAAATASPPHTAAPPPGTPPRALVVADQPVLAGVVRLALNHGQYLAHTAGSAAEAVALLAAWRPAPGRPRHGPRRRPAAGPARLRRRRTSTGSRSSP